MFEISAKKGLCYVICGSEVKTSDLAAHFHTILALQIRFCSGGSSIEADKALPHPQSPRFNTLQYFYLQYSKMWCIVKGNNIFKSKNIFWFRNFEF